MKYRMAVTSYLNNRAYFQHPLPASCSLQAMYPRQAIAAVTSGKAQAAMLPVAGLAAVAPVAELFGEYGIAACGPVKSVLFFSDIPFDRLGSQHAIQLSNQSATSVNLLALLLSYRLGQAPLPVALPDHLRGQRATGELLIGDDALAAEQAHGYRYVTDLSEQWAQHHHLPFVFARWVLRRDASPGFRDALTTWLQGFVEQDAGIVAGEGPAAGIGAVHARGKTDDQQARLGIAEGRHRPGMVVGILCLDVVEETGQPRTAPAIGVEQGITHGSPVLRPGPA